MQYPRAPIVEAILELRFREPVDLELAQKTADKFQPNFPISEDQENFQVVVGSTGEVGRRSEWAGRKRSNLDATDVLRVATTSFTTMRLAPYAGWEQLFNRTKEQWPRVRKGLGKPTIGRLGVRYINRVDIPTTDKLDVEEYLNFGPRVPDDLDLLLNSYFIQATTAVKPGTFGVTFHSGGVPSPLAGC